MRKLISEPVNVNVPVSEPGFVYAHGHVHVHGQRTWYDLAMTLTAPFPC